LTIGNTSLMYKFRYIITYAVPKNVIFEFQHWIG
jgi:hypothetical protein